MVFCLFLFCQAVYICNFVDEIDGGVTLYFFHLASPSPCSVSPCLNGGTCLTKGLTSYKCICRHGFRGSNCEGITFFG